MKNLYKKSAFKGKIKIIAVLALFAVILYGFTACDDNDDIDETMKVKLAFVNV